MKRKILESIVIENCIIKKWCDKHPTIRELVIKSSYLEEIFKDLKYGEEVRLRTGYHVDNETLYGIYFGKSILIFLRPLKEGYRKFDDLDKRDEYLKELKDEFIFELGKVLKLKAHPDNKNYVAFSEISEIFGGDKRIIKNIVDEQELEFHVKHLSSKKGPDSLHFNINFLEYLFVDLTL